MHLGVSVVLGGFAAAMVLGVLYPPPYAQMVGGLSLFGILAAVDVVCGPLLTFVVFNPVKSRRELMLDLGLIAVLQMSAFGYGMYTLWDARPVYLVFEVDRFYVVTHANIPPDSWAAMPPGVPPPKWAGTQMLATRVAQPGDADYIEQLGWSIAGLGAAYRPDRWMSYESSAMHLRERAQPLSLLRQLHPDAEAAITDEVKKTGKTQDQLRWLPVQAKRGTDWVALLEFDSLKVVGFLPLDGWRTN